MLAQLMRTSQAENSFWTTVKVSAIGEEAKSGETLTGVYGK